MPLPLRFLIAVFLILIAAGSLVLIKNSMEDDGATTQITGLAPQGDATPSSDGATESAQTSGAAETKTPVADTSGSDTPKTDTSNTGDAGTSDDGATVSDTGSDSKAGDQPMAATDQPSATDPATKPDTQTTEKPATAQDGGTATGMASKPSNDATGDSASDTAGAATETATTMDTDDTAAAPETDTAMAAKTGTDAATGATSEAAMTGSDGASTETGMASVESGAENSAETSAASESADQMAKSATGESAGEAQTGAMKPDATQPADNAADDVASNVAPSGGAEATAQAGQSGAAKSQDQLPTAGNGNDENAGGESVVTMVHKGDAPAAEGTNQNVTEVAKSQPGAASLGALDTDRKTVPASDADSGAAEKPAMPVGIAEIPRFDVVRVEPTGEAVLAGRGSPGARVEIIANGQVIAEAIAGPSGEWVVVPDRPLPPGANDISARARIADGPAVESEEKVAIAVPEQPDGGMLIIRNRPNAPSEILVDTTKSTESAAVAETVPETLTTPFVIEAVEAEGSEVFVAGAGATGARVRVYADNVFLGETIVGQGDRWLLQEPKALPFGDLTIRADMTDDAGTVVSRAEVPFSRPARMAAVTPPAEAAPTASTGETGQAMPAASVATADPMATKTDAVKPTTIIIRRGDNLWTIARRTYGRGIRYTTIFEANSDQIRNPHMIFPGQVFMLPEKEDGTAN